MSQRNPLNDRYQTERKGQSKKSAASAKPKQPAAASVYVQPAKKKTKAEKKAAEKKQRAKQAELDKRYYNPPTPRYKKLRRIWWVLIAVAIVCTVLGMALSQYYINGINATWFFLFPAYAMLIAAIILDLTKIRTARREYQDEMVKSKGYKELRRAEAEANAAKQKMGLVDRVKWFFGSKVQRKKAKAALEEQDAKAAAAEADPEAAAAAAREEEDRHKTIAQLKAEREAAKAAESEAVGVAVVDEAAGEAAAGEAADKKAE